MGEMPILVTRDELSRLLGQMRLLQEAGFLVPVPVLSETQSNDLFTLFSQVDLGPTIAIGFSAMMKKTGSGPLFACGTKVNENTGQIAGRSEIVVCGELGKNTYTLTAVCGHDRSLDFVRLCSLIGVDHLAQTKRPAMGVADVKKILKIIATWTRQISAPNAQQAR